MKVDQNKINQYLLRVAKLIENNKVDLAKMMNSIGVNISVNSSDSDFYEAIMKELQVKNMNMIHGLAKLLK